MSRFLAILGMWLVFASPAAMAAERAMQALARLEPSASSVSARLSGDVDIVLALSRSIPFRVFTLADPARLVLDFRQLDFAGLDPRAFVQTPRVGAVRWGLFRPGWSRMVLELTQPMRVDSAAMKSGASGAVISIRLTGEEAAAFAAGAEARPADLWALPDPVEVPLARHRYRGDRKLVVALDPGHGGIDPGARHGGVSEADLVLSLAREAAEQLRLTGRFEVFLTRREDVFLSLEDRVSAARRRRADVFLSLHTDALAEGRASGTTVYTLAATASDRAAELLAKSHDRSDLLAGVDLSGQDDLVASVLMDMARTETAPRSEKLAAALVAAIARAVGKQRPRPPLSAGFSVLKAPDIPSVLIELGFLSNPHDLALLKDKAWRGKAILGMIAALDKWALADAAQARLLRK